MRKAIALAALFSAPLIWGSSVSQTAPDYVSLYRRVSESAFVVKATLAKMEHFPRRVAPELLGTPGYEAADLVNNGGMLYTLTIKETLCRRSDWSSSESTVRQIEGPVYIFVPRTEPALKANPMQPFSPDLKEFFVPGTEYLLFLREDPQQAELGKIYDIEPSRTYYRAYWGRRGAVELPPAERKGNPRDFATPLLSGVRALCQAVQSPDPAAKRNRLAQLKSFTGDPSWVREVDEAIKALDNEGNR
jgi:hypothetical protein